LHRRRLDELPCQHSGAIEHCLALYAHPHRKWPGVRRTKVSADGDGLEDG
jgi:hypothetical protein